MKAAQSNETMSDTGLKSDSDSDSEGSCIGNEQEKEETLRNNATERINNRFAKFQSEFNTSISLQNISDEILKDVKWSPVYQYLNNHILPNNRKQANKIRSISESFTISEGALYKVTKFSDPLQELNYKLVIPNSLIQTVLKSLHHDITGHFGLFKTYSNASRFFYWTSMYNSIQRFIGNCQICYKFKRSQHRLRVPMAKFDRPSFPMSDIHMDLIGPLKLTSCKRYRYILVIVDRFSRYVVTSPLRTKSQQEVINAFYRNHVCIHGIPQTIYSDRGTEFKNVAFNSICKLYNIKQSFTSGYSSSSNGLAERQIQNVINALRTSMHSAETSWNELLPQVTFNINNSVCRATNFSPFFLVYGRHAKTLQIHHDIENIGKSEMSELAKIIQNQTIAHQVAFQFNEFYDDMNKQSIDATRSFKDQIQIGSMVYLYKPVSDDVSNSKMAAHYNGPYVVIDLLPRHNVQLKHCMTGRVLTDPVHVSRLKLAKYMQQN